MRKPQGHHSKEAQGMLRIIGGQWRSRKLHFQAAEGLRPTSDRIRETLFNWLAPISTAQTASTYSLAPAH